MYIYLHENYIKRVCTFIKHLNAGWDPTRLSSSFSPFYGSFGRQLEQKGSVADEIMKGSFPQRIRRKKWNKCRNKLTPEFTFHVLKLAKLAPKK